MFGPHSPPMKNQLFTEVNLELFSERRHRLEALKNDANRTRSARRVERVGDDSLGLRRSRRNGSWLRNQLNPTVFWNKAYLARVVFALSAVQKPHKFLCYLTYLNQACV